MVLDARLIAKKPKCKSWKKKSNELKPIVHLKKTPLLSFSGGNTKKVNTNSLRSHKIMIKNIIV